uniref:Uncharacterized protein n=2 Tax=Rhodosorus marinus TaxID=101924 RepID=A0A7S2ZXC9_9RHOD|mmetsp:Transcript_36284/g.145123  ORF Transcript_36284/g.145123 Transcript_36284/m.145123 type:complete len:192 (+) Transcript_36284:296-871(+)
MGCISSRISRSDGNVKSLLMIGLDGAGSTTILYRLVLNKCIDTIPTLGVNQESLSFGGIDYDIWDMGGLDKMRPLWKQYSRATDAYIFVLDAADQERAILAADELESFFDDIDLKSHEIPGDPLLVYANKKDLPDAMTTSEIENMLKLPELPVSNYKIVPCCGKTGENLREGLEWLTDELKQTVTTSDFLT